jgi:hypothetical protein
MKERKDIGIDEVRRRLYKAYALQDFLADVALGVLIGAVVFGIGFTCGYYHAR